MRVPVMITLISLAIPSLVVGLSEPREPWVNGRFKTMVTFGDSFTDEGRLSYIINNEGALPPIGWDQPVGHNAASGGLSWARYASIYANTRLYNYAVSGAVCSNEITPRILSAINNTFPDVAGYEVSTFLAETRLTDTNASTHGGKFFTGTPDSTVYAIWIGTNDLGNDGFLTASQVENKTVADYIDCVYNAMWSLHAHAGAKNFVLLNLAPLDLFPQYALPSAGGINGTQFYPADGRNLTDVHYRMKQTVAGLNQVYQYRSATEARDGIQIANFDVHSLMSAIHANPSQYLNGSMPLNVTGTVNQCDITGSNCTLANSPDSYMFYDPLHPGEQTSRVLAREFAAVLNGTSKYAMYWG